MRPVRVFLADDHALVRSGLRAVIEAQPDVEVGGEAGDGASAVAAIEATGPDVAVLDVSLPVLDGRAVAARLHESCPAIKLLALSAHEDRGYVRQMLEAGVSGYVVKRSAAEELIRAIRAVATGAVYIDPCVAGSLVSSLFEGHAASSGSGAELSERETQVLRLLARGHAMKEIAASLDVGLRTVETYRARAMEKLGLTTRAELVRYAVGKRWLDPT